MDDVFLYNLVSMVEKNKLVEELMITVMDTKQSLLSDSLYSNKLHEDLDIFHASFMLHLHVPHVVSDMHTTDQRAEVEHPEPGFELQGLKLWKRVMIPKEGKTRIIWDRECFAPWDAKRPDEDMCGNYRVMWRGYGMSKEGYGTSQQHLGKMLSFANCNLLKLKPVEHRNNVLCKKDMMILTCTFKMFCLTFNEYNDIANRISPDPDRTWVDEILRFTKPVGYGPTTLLLRYSDRKESLFKSQHRIRMLSQVFVKIFIPSDITSYGYWLWVVSSGWSFVSAILGQMTYSVASPTLDSAGPSGCRGASFHTEERFPV
ncbi:hypothetical protein Tco_1293789 [Tanacetum coccineum]